MFIKTPDTIRNNLTCLSSLYLTYNSLLILHVQIEMEKLATRGEKEYGKF